MISRDDITFIVQGPLHLLGLSCVPLYLERGQVVISSWSNSDLTLFGALEDNLKKVKVVLSDREGIEDYKNDGSYDNTGNSLLQATTSAAGLMNCTTKYAIKVRCDEYLPSWDRFIERMAAGKFVHSNRFARKAVEPYHFGDTYWGGRTDVLRPALQWMVETSLNHGFRGMEVCGRKMLLSAEQKICISIIKQLEPDFAFNEANEIMRRYFDICPLSEMGEFKINSSGWARDGLPNPRGEFDARKWGCISSLDQL